MATVPPVVQESLLIRLYRAFDPLAGGMLIDLIDFITFGPVKPYFGLMLGTPITWWVTSIYGLSVPTRILIALLGGTYCMLPYLELFPVATMISAIARFQPQLPVTPTTSAPTNQSESSPSAPVEAEEDAIGLCDV